MDGGENLLRRLSEVTPRSVDWVWEGLIPRGKVTLLTGDAGIGKSLVALQVAAMVTRGRRVPIGLTEKVPTAAFQTEPRGVIVLSAEDAAEDTVLPRLLAAGGDVSRTFVLRTESESSSERQPVVSPAPLPIPATQDDHLGHEIEKTAAEDPPAPDCRAKGSQEQDDERLFRLKRDFQKLERAIEQLNSQGEQIGLVVIDPIDRFLSPQDKKRDRAHTVTKLVDLAARFGAAILVVSSASLKAGGRSNTVLHQELVNSARAVLTVAPDLEDRNQRLLLPVKLNLSAMQPALSFTIEQGSLNWSPEPIALSSDDYYREAILKQKNPLVREEVYEIQRVTRWLKDQLTPGRASSIWIRCNAGYYDISYSTLRRAFKILGCRAIRESNQWFWHLPGQEQSAPSEIREQPLESPQGELTGILRESMPKWLQDENARQTAKIPPQIAMNVFSGCGVSSPIEEDAHQVAQRAPNGFWDDRFVEQGGS
ncbi:AAA family ATPase [Schlesneria sp. DSM 10557]|uniref:AAA family ATPase n=1 Tax=Schlesneria sp. DSM 10557 TaxID=3044399 RepID=UPI00359F3C2B